jgi:hypothetical protein
MNISRLRKLAGIFESVDNNSVNEEIIFDETISSFTIDNFNSEIITARLQYLGIDDIRVTATNDGEKVQSHLYVMSNGAEKHVVPSDVSDRVVNLYLRDGEVIKLSSELINFSNILQALIFDLGIEFYLELTRGKFAGSIAKLTQADYFYQGAVIINPETKQKIKIENKTGIRTARPLPEYNGPTVLKLRPDYKETSNTEHNISF